MQYVPFSDKILLNSVAFKCIPTLVGSKFSSCIPSTTICFLILILSLRKDFKLFSIAKFNLIPFKGTIWSNSDTKSLNCFFGKESCAFIPSVATYILPSTPILDHEENK